MSDGQILHAVDISVPYMDIPSIGASYVHIPADSDEYARDLASVLALAAATKA